MSEEDSLETYLSSLDEWQNDQRALGYFSSFKGNFEDAPENWNHKIQFWFNLLLKSVPNKWVGNVDILCFEDSKIPHYFQRKGVSPLGIPMVIVSDVS
jgi:hypothetical protein